MDETENKVVVLDAWRKRQQNAGPAPVVKSSADPLRNVVRAAAGDTWAGKFKVETPDGEGTQQSLEVKGFATVLGTFDLQKVLNRLVTRNERQIREYKDVVAGYSDEELQAWLANPKDSDLQRKPYFFHALIDEAKKRFLFGKTTDAEPPE